LINRSLGAENEFYWSQFHSKIFSLISLVSLKQGTISATKMHARRLKHHKSNFDVVANKFSVQLEEPIMNLLRIDVAEYIRSKDIVVSQLEVSGCKAKLEITKEKTRPKTAEEKAAKMASKKNKPGMKLYIS
jgi:hypothetical protein